MLKKILKISRSFVVPGPGMYDIKTKNKGIRYTMGYRRDQKIKSLKSPSVGDYDLRRDDDLVVPSIIFGREKREVSETNEKVPRTPGPGYYYISTEVTSSSSPKWSFSPINQSLEKSKRKREEESKSPGPGSYNIEGFIGKEGKMFSFNKDKYNHSDVSEEMMFKKCINFPTPTTYNLKNNKCMSDGPKWRISELPRKNVTDDKFKISIPGPGKYNLQYEKKSNYKKLPVWTFNQSSKNEDKNSKGEKIERFNTPPPGHYTINNGAIPQGIKYCPCLPGSWR